MATRSHIGIRNQDGTVEYIYCHWDGYPEHNGVILTEHYDTLDKVKELIALGDLSFLGPEIGEKHDFDGELNATWCRAYGRDRNDPNTEAKTISFNDLLENEGLNVSYVYVFDGDYWECFDTSNSSKIINLYSKA